MIADIGQYLQQQQVGTVGEDIFIGYFPETPDDCITLLETEGLNVTPGVGTGTETPGLQVTARWKDVYSAAENKLNAIHAVLKAIGFEDGENAASLTATIQSCPKALRWVC